MRPLKAAMRVFDEARFIQCVGMNGDLHVVFVGHRQATVDRRRCRAPVFVQFQSVCACFNLFLERSGRLALPLP